MENAGIFRFFKPTQRLSPTRIILVDDHRIVLDGIRNLLEKDSQFALKGAFTSAEEALQFLRSGDADLLITDFNLPDVDGLSLIHAAKRALPDLKIIVLSMHNEVHLVKEILRSGVNGFVLKNDSHKELIQAINEVLSGKVFLSSDVSKLLIQSMDSPDEGKLLTEREREILKLIAREYSNRDIAAELFISERTVETHRKNIFSKTGTSSLVGLIKFAYANNLI